MKRVMRVASVIAVFAMAGAAHATEDVTCKASNNAAWISFVAGTTPGLAPLGLSMGAGDKIWSTAKENGGTLVEVKQAFSTEDDMKIDVIATGKPAGSLRAVFGHEEGQEPVLAGVLHINGVGAWPVVCGDEGEEPEEAGE